ncbi:MAG: hypothetical protein JSS86_18765 [Cyanobacteria bacterium SZAS LIN-2]|nr:hypothetical protein [Cyanobacteria bacterium SZAS LIN-2]
MGAAFLANEEYKKALIELNKAISIDPLDANFRHTRAWALWRLEQTQQALDELRFAINLSPDAPLLSSLGSFLYMLGDNDEALKVLSKAISKASTAAEAALYLRKRGLTFLALNQDEFALLDLNKAIEIDPGDAANYRERAEIYQKMNRLNEAINDCSQALTVLNSDPEIYCLRCQCYFQQNNLSLALEDAMSAIQLDEYFAPAHFLMGRILMEDGQIPLAMQFFVSTISFDQKCAEAYLYLSICFDLMKSPKEAHQYSRKAAALDPAFKKYTLESTRKTLISPALLERMPSAPAITPQRNKGDFYPGTNPSPINTFNLGTNFR